MSLYRFNAIAYAALVKWKGDALEMSVLHSRKRWSEDNEWSMCNPERYTGLYIFSLSIYTHYMYLYIHIYTEEKKT